MNTSTKYKISLSEVKAQFEEAKSVFEITDYFARFLTFVRPKPCFSLEVITTSWEQWPYGTN